jgi:hypothetical protein
MENFLAAISFEIKWVIKNPDITKKMSTPRNPLSRPPISKWKNNTKIMAMPLSPSMSAL